MSPDRKPSFSVRPANPDQVKKLADSLERNWKAKKKKDNEVDQPKGSNRWAR